MPLPGFPPGQKKAPLDAHVPPIAAATASAAMSAGPMPSGPDRVSEGRLPIIRAMMHKGGG
jgi:hypothetical protein